ncbi:hypothetical protein QTP70_016959 [Hemibagrus guttatus]|uniref:Cadherin domain-containing protein n=1 Tax=Hemibagrus guttatus TaxID=175788 RepID=A0AAE0R9C3_9TELE|nr:hypothetical protein QTP70_016959 [Hemibagrus guttatus]
MYRSVVVKQELSRKAKLSIYQSIYAPTLTYGHELWVMTERVIWVKADKAELQTLHRQKRNWIIPPRKLFENVDYTRKDYIAKIRSDAETRTNIRYSLLGPAVDNGLFSVDKNSGLVKIHGILDREKEAFYELKGRATLPDGTLVENDLDLEIIVLDQNDNAPEFELNMNGSIEELSDKDTMVLTVTAKDKDQEGTTYSKITYNVIQQEPPGKMMFKISRTSGEIKVNMNTLDREHDIEIEVQLMSHDDISTRPAEIRAEAMVSEVLILFDLSAVFDTVNHKNLLSTLRSLGILEKQESYKLLITATDMDGADFDTNNKPMTGTGTVTINIHDVNDNIPTMENASYESSVEENIKNKEVIRIKTIDKDKEYTDNWVAVYTIISENEAGYFNITTDPKTNEGILMVTKELDYEKVKEISLKVVVNNKAPYHKSVVNDKIMEYPINIKVQNVREAPHFHPLVKEVRVSEDPEVTDLSKVIITFTATDSDTLLTATKVKYLKGEDVDHWVSINEQTGEVRLIKYPDHESEYVKNGTYYVKIIAITDDFAHKTATGTLAIKVEDINDNAPILNSSVEMMYYGDSIVYVSATDKDHVPNAEPFDFILANKSTNEKWIIKRFNATTGILQSQEILWPGQYTVELQVKDKKGKFSEVQKLQVFVSKRSPERQTGTGTVLGAGGVLVLLIGILLLLAIPMLLLVCKCGAVLGINQVFPFEPEQQLIIYNTEGQGEDKELIELSPFTVNLEGGSSRKLEAEWEAHEDLRRYGWESYVKHADYVDFMETGSKRHSDFLTSSTYNSMVVSNGFLRDYYAKPLLTIQPLLALMNMRSVPIASAMTYCLVPFSENWVTYKIWEIINQETSPNDLLVCSYEDCISVTSSLDDISKYLHEENYLDFLDNLGPQFKRLADLCCGPAILEVSTTPTLAKTISSSSQMGVKVEGAVDVHNEATSVSASSSSSTTQITNTNYAENRSSGSATLAATVGQTLLVQQPTVYFSSTPMYLVEQQHQHQPDLLLASGTVLGVQERNRMLVEKGATNMAVTAQNMLPSLGLQQVNTRILVDPGIGGTLVHGFSGPSELQGTSSGTFCVVESRNLESMEPVHVM